MEPIKDLLPDAGKAMSGSSGSRSSASHALRLDDKICPHCGRDLEAEWVGFPPALQQRYGKPGEWYYHPCTPECEKKNEQRGRPGSILLRWSRHWQDSSRGRGDERAHPEKAGTLALRDCAGATGQPARSVQ